MTIEAMKRIKSLLQDTKMIDSHTISAVVAECDMAILAQQPATGEPVKAAPYNPTEEMRWAMKRIDPALSSEQCRALWSAAWSASPSTHPSPSVPDVDFELQELREIERAMDDFADCGETDVVDTLLLRAVQAGFLECTHFHVANRGALQEAIDDAMLAAKEPS